MLYQSVRHDRPARVRGGARRADQTRRPFVAVGVGYRQLLLANCKQQSKPKKGYESWHLIFPPRLIRVHLYKDRPLEGPTICRPHRLSMTREGYRWRCERRRTIKRYFIPLSKVAKEYNYEVFDFNHAMIIGGVGGAMTIKVHILLRGWGYSQNVARGKETQFFAVQGRSIHRSVRTPAHDEVGQVLCSTNMVTLLETAVVSRRIGTELKSFRRFFAAPAKVDDRSLTPVHCGSGAADDNLLNRRLNVVSDSQFRFRMRSHQTCSIRAPTGDHRALQDRGGVHVFIRNERALLSSKTMCSGFKDIITNRCSISVYENKRHVAQPVRHDGRPGGADNAPLTLGTMHRGVLAGTTRILIY
ncbi:hypothetical protein EVAR_17291_1 [Eumeta japonica]|uniref:Uncharacterized protein n=1 Tax=Eumeta variegata TaxID=151549 RepID=A0A4C1TT26_EUMVA|nr:hypothetical protein EVAR_17291_1 [Eumeta japonica]